MSLTPLGFMTLAGLDALQNGRDAKVYSTSELDHCHAVFFIDNEAMNAIEDAGVVATRFCESCINFVVNEHAVSGYNTCSKKHRMLFRTPEDYPDDDYGFYRHKCKDRKDKNLPEARM